MNMRYPGPLPPAHLHRHIVRDELVWLGISRPFTLCGGLCCRSQTDTYFRQFQSTVLHVFVHPPRMNICHCSSDLSGSLVIVITAYLVTSHILCMILAWESDYHGPSIRDT